MNKNLLDVVSFEDADGARRLISVNVDDDSVFIVSLAAGEVDAVPTMVTRWTFAEMLASAAKSVGSFYESAGGAAVRLSLRSVQVVTMRPRSVTCISRETASRIARELEAL